VASAARAQLGVIAANVLVTYVALKAQNRTVGVQQLPLDASLRAPRCDQTCDSQHAS